MRIFEYLFMQRAFVVGILLAAVVPCVGMVVVCKRLSMIGDALSHTSLAGVAAGLLLGVNPVAGAAAACVAASFGIEAIRRKLPRYSEMSISIIMSAGIGLAGVLSGFVKNSANFNSFLFGSIVAISDAEMISVIVVSVVVLALFLLLLTGNLHSQESLSQSLRSLAYPRLCSLTIVTCIQLYIIIFILTDKDCHCALACYAGFYNRYPTFIFATY